MHLKGPGSVNLQQMCQSEDWQGILHPYHTIRGIVFAAASAPEIPMPETWFPWVIKHSGTISEMQIQELSSALLELLQQCLKKMRDNEFSLPEECEFNETELSNEPLRQWLTGLLLAHKNLQGVWQDSWDKMVEKSPESCAKLQQDLSHCLRMFSTFADAELALVQAQQRGNDKLESVLPKIFLSFPKALKQYVDISGELVTYIPNQFETFEKVVN